MTLQRFKATSMFPTKLHSLTVHRNMMYSITKQKERRAAMSRRNLLKNHVIVESYSHVIRWYTIRLFCLLQNVRICYTHRIAKGKARPSKLKCVSYMEWWVNAYEITLFPWQLLIMTKKNSHWCHCSKHLLCIVDCDLFFRPVWFASGHDVPQ